MEPAELVDVRNHIQDQMKYASKFVSDYRNYAMQKIIKNFWVYGS